MKILLILFSSVVIPAYSQPTQKFTAHELQEDFKIFRGSLEDFHPGLYWYRSNEEMNEVFDRVQTSLTVPLTEKEFIRTLAPVISFFGCGHTWIVPPENGRSKKLLPLKLMLHNQRAFCRANLSDDSLLIKPQDEILSINGISMDSLVSSLMRFLPGDGFITTGKSFMLDNYFTDLYPQYFETTDEFKLKIKEPNGHKKEVTLPSISSEQIALNTGSKKMADPRNLTLQFDEGISTAILKVKRFFDWKEAGKTIRFESRLQELFDSIDSAAVDNLTIDVRNNGGGKVPWVLLSYFVDEEFVLARQADFIFSKKSPYYQYQKLHPAMRFLNRKWLHTWLPGSNKMKKKNDYTYTLTGLFMTNPYKPTKPQFKGAVYILTNGGSLSATSDFVAMMKSNRVAIMVGEETGGGYYGNTSMERSFVTLPNTKLMLEIPLVRHQLNVNPDVELGRGVEPDYYVPETLDDKLNNTNSQLEYVLDLIKSENNLKD